MLRLVLLQRDLLNAGLLLVEVDTKEEDSDPMLCFCPIASRDDPRVRIAIEADGALMMLCEQGHESPRQRRVEAIARDHGGEIVPYEAIPSEG